MSQVDGDESRVFPVWLVASAFIVLIGAVLLFMAQRPVGDPPSPPWPMVGCYSTPNGPDIQIDQSSLAVLQDPPIKVGSSIKFLKGWAFDIDRWLDFQKRADGRIEIVPGSENGEFLQVSREGEWASSKPGFELINRATGLAIRYSRSSDECS